MATSETVKPGKRQWHYKPELPLRVSPLFVWPFNPLKAFGWILNSWFPVSERLILVGFALISWFYLTPTLERSRSLSVDWIAEIYFRNLALMIIVAGGLHLYFYTLRKQGQQKNTMSASWSNQTGCSPSIRKFWIIFSGRWRVVSQSGRGTRY